MEVDEASAVGHRPPASGSRFLPWLATLELLLAAAAGALWYLQGGWVWYHGSWPGPRPLILLGLVWVLRLARSLGTPEGRRQLRPSVFTVPLLLFLATAAVSYWAAYDREIALAKVWLFIGALGLYWAMAGQPDLPRIYAALAIWAGFCIVLTAYFFLTFDWSAYAPKIPALTALGAAISARLPSLAARHLNPDVVAGLLSVTLPLTVPLIALLGRRDVPGLGPGFGRTTRRLLGALGVVALGAGALCVLLTVSRGAYVALAATAVLWLAWWLLTRWRVPRPRLVLTALILAGGLVAAALAALSLNGTLHPDPHLGEALGRLSAPSVEAALANRWRILRLGALLVRDTPFTGIGLGMFEMHFSVYALLIHVGYIEHSHNLLLDLAIEQGLPGAITYLALVATALLWRPHGPRNADRGLTPDPWSLPRLAALASLSTTLIHGILDDTLYGSRGILLLFLPFGLLVAAGRRVEQPRRQRRPVLARAALWAAGLTVLLAGGIIGLRGHAGAPLRAEWAANLGAIAQARVELNVYDQAHFSDPTMSEVRRHEDLSEAMAHFERALALDPLNATARERLTAIALARGDYEAGLVHMQTLWDAGPPDPSQRDRVTRLLYSDALVDAGRVEEAATIVQGLEFAKDRLLGQSWARQHESGDAERAAYARQAAELVGNAEAANAAGTTGN